MYVCIIVFDKQYLRNIPAFSVFSYMVLLAMFSREGVLAYKGSGGIFYYVALLMPDAVYAIGLL